MSNLDITSMQQTQTSDTYELLSTKLALPRPHQSLVRRESLLARLDDGLQHKLTLLSAPAGFGKTTLVSEWIVMRGERQDALPVAWVSLDAGDNDPVRFWRYSIAACRAFHEGVGATSFDLLRVSRRLPLEAVITAFINELARVEREGVLVLEDYHLITSPQIHETVAYFVDHLPAMLHLLLLTRNDPALPLARLRAHDDLYELHAADLRFTSEETRAFLGQALAFPLSPETSARLETRTEGWVVGLRLLALALQGRKDPRELERVLTTFTGSHRHILEYLVADVLSSQPEALQEFLLQTAFLNRLNASLCDMVTGRNDSERMLELLERANLFLMPLDDTEQWYRYHALFAEAMQHEARLRFGDSYLRPLYDKASCWYEQHGLLAEAVEVAFSAKDFGRAADLIELIVSPNSEANELHTLLRWVAQLPEETLQTHPRLCLSYATALLFTLDRSDPMALTLILAPLEMAERKWQSEDNRPKLGEALALRSQVAWWQGDLAQAFAAARQSLDLLPDQATIWRAAAVLAVGIDEMQAGKFDVARQMTLRARALFETARNPFGARAATFVSGEVCSQQGDLHLAVRYYRQLIDEAEEDPFDMASALIGLAALAYEWNNLQEAEKQVTQALDLCKRHSDEIGKYHAEQFLLIPGSLALARVLLVRGEITKAQQLLQELVMLTQEHRWPYLHREALAYQARLALAVGDLASVQQWATTIEQLGQDLRLVQQEQEAFIIARLLIAQGDAETALRLLEPWHAYARAEKRHRSELEILVLKSLAHWNTHKHSPHTVQIIIQALTLARPEGYQRLFLNEGQAMAAALRAALPEIREEPLAMYARALLYTFASQHAERVPSPSASSSATASFFEPLSAQEQRVLRLLAAGRSNPEIAQALIVSINTVKTQVQSIYRKLNVNGRKEARDVARQLKLL